MDLCPQQLQFGFENESNFYSSLEFLDGFDLKSAFTVEAGGSCAFLNRQSGFSPSNLGILNAMDRFPSGMASKWTSPSTSSRPSSRVPGRRSPGTAFRR